MAKVRCLRGVCIGVDRHLKPGDVADIDSPQFLISINAVELVPDAPIVPPPTTETPGKPGKKE